MKKLFFTAAAALVAFSGLFAQTECTTTTTAEVQLTRRDMTHEDSLVVCDALESQISFYRATPGSLPGLFSIAKDAAGNPTQWIRFSKGNLQYQHDNEEGPCVWKFADHQWEVLSKDRYAKMDSAYFHQNHCDTLWFDIFTRGSSGYGDRSPVRYNNANWNAAYSKTEYDWGWHNKIFMGGDSAKLWYVPTQAIWNYLLSRRDKEDQLLYFTGTITIGEQLYNGVFFLPDNYVSQPDITFSRGAVSNNYTNNVITEEQWNTLESLGVVFLPVTGYRYHATLTDFRDLSSGVYCRGDGAGDYSIHAYFSETSCGMKGLGPAWNSYVQGAAVRLIQDFNPVP